MTNPKIIRACTVPMSLGFVTGMLPELQKKYEVVLLSSPGPEWKRVKEQYPEVKGIEVEMERHISPVKDLKALIGLWRVFRQERPQMVHSMTPKAGLLCMMAARLAGVPVRVHTFTGLVFPTAIGMKRKVLMATDWLTCACATHIIPEGEGVKRDLLTHGITRKPIEVLGYGSCMGIDLRHFDRREEVMEQAASLRKEGTVTFITIGRLVGDKGINELVRAFAKLYSEDAHTRLVLVGKEEQTLDPLQADTLQTIASCEGIEAVGAQSDVRPWLAASDVAVLASYREGFPNVVIEAGAMGLPQIVTDINGANEIVCDGVNGIIIPSKDEQALNKAMKRMLAPEVRAELSAQARKRIAERYEQSYVRQCLMEFYEKINPV